MEQYDRGSAITIEVEFKKYTPFTGHTYFDPNTFTITVTDSAGAKKVDAVSLEKKETGKYFYVVQTEKTWEDGTYIVEINSTITAPSNKDVTIDPDLFYLK